LSVERGIEVRLGFIHGEGRLVRATGWILLIAGGLLCATLVWATVGFLLMGIGLLSLLVAENNRKRTRPAEVSDTYVHQPMAALPPVAAPPPVPEAGPFVRREPSMEPIAPAPSYDRQAWQQLVESDADLARVAAVLGDYGHQYVDELAREYLAVGDKTRLPEIVDGIIGRARAGVAPRISVKPANEVRPANSVRRSNLMAPRPDRQPRPLPPAELKVSEILPDPTPQPVEPVEPVKQEAVSAPVPPPIVVEPEPAAKDRAKTIIGADEELTAMLGRLSPDSASPAKN
jgi:hypothetical protein